MTAVTAGARLRATQSTDPASQTVPSGTAVTFTAEVTGEPAPTLQWLRDGAPMPGETGTTLSLTATVADSGVGFSVEATNSQGTATSAVAVLTVTASQEVLFVASSSPVPAGEASIVTLIENMGFTVVQADDDTVASADATGKALVVIGGSVSPSKIGSKFTASTVPVITWEYLLYDDLGMTLNQSGQRGQTASFNTIDIVSGHPLAAGLTGSPQISTSAKALTYGIPSTAADVVATQPGKPNKAVIFGYEVGDAMQVGTAPAKRVGLFLSLNTPASLNANGEALVEAAVNWATS